MSSARRAYDLLRGYIATEWERIQGVEDTFAEAELNEVVTRPSASVPSSASETLGIDGATRARQILGVGEKADFVEIRASFERLNKRSDPANFPANSREAAQAAEIQKRVNWAYSILTESIDSTEKRFKSLEIQ